MKFKFIQDHTLTALVKAILYIVIVSGIFFGIESIIPDGITEKSKFAYVLTMAFSAIFLHFYDREDKV